MIEELLRDPEAVRAPKGNTVQVLVPKVAAPPPPPTPITIHLAAAPPPVASSQRQVVVVGDEDGELADEASAQTKRVALQRKADAAKVAAEDYARKFEAGDVVVATKDDTADEHGVSNTNVFCRMCFLGEKEGNERARRMLSCKVCSKKYHRSCLKSWAQNRDLFHWSSWTCPSCRTCEICRKAGDPSKFMFCRRCDGAYHCYCLHPPHKVHERELQTVLLFVRSLDMLRKSQRAVLFTFTGFLTTFPLYISTRKCPSNVSGGCKVST